MMRSTLSGAPAADPDDIGICGVHVGDKERQRKDSPSSWPPHQVAKAANGYKAVTLNPKNLRQPPATKPQQPRRQQRSRQ
eukprot:88667-Chlamydomonas_euryale.AAC.2